MKKKFLLILLFCFALYCITLFGCGDGNNYTIENFKNTKTLEYKIEEKLSIEATNAQKSKGEIKRESTVKDGVSKVNENGNIERKITYEKIKMVVGTEEEKVYEFKKEDKYFILLHTKEGKTLDIKGLEVEDLNIGEPLTCDLKRIYQEMQIELPKNNLKIGSKWKSERKMKLMGKNYGKLQEEMQWISIENVNSEKCAKINVSFNFPFSTRVNYTSTEEYKLFKLPPDEIVLNGTEKGNGQAYFSISLGRIIKEEMNIEGNFTLQELYLHEEENHGDKHENTESKVHFQNKISLNIVK